MSAMMERHLGHEDENAILHRHRSRLLLELAAKEVELHDARQRERHMLEALRNLRAHVQNLELQRRLDQEVVSSFANENAQQRRRIERLESARAAAS